MRRSFSIITTSKGRLEHLKLSVPNMLRQGGAETIVVDFSCPQGTGKYVQAHFPLARVVSVQGEENFSNWKARNAGASAASADLLLFCDADTILADDALAWIADHLPDNAFGFFKRGTTAHLDSGGGKLAKNQLKGFHVIPSEAFWRIGGYDEVLLGYAAGGDTDLLDRLRLNGLKPFALDPAIIASVIHHDKAERTRHHRDPIAISYGAGLLYRSAKLSLLRFRKAPELPLEERRQLYETATAAARKLGPRQTVIGMTVDVESKPVRMARELGYERGTRTLSLKIEVSVENRLAEIPE